MADITSEEAKKINENLFGDEASVSGEPVTTEEPAPPANEKPLDEAAVKRIEELKKFLHDIIAEQLEKPDAFEGNYRNQNRIFKFLCADSTLDDAKCAQKFFDSGYGNIGVTRIENFFKDYKIVEPQKRRDFFKWAAETVGLFVKALETGNGNDFARYSNRNKDRVDADSNKNSASYPNRNRGYNGTRGKSRIFCLTLCYRHPELFQDDAAEKLERLGDGYARDVHDAITKWLYNKCNQGDSASESDSERQVKNLKRDLNRKESELEQTRAELKQAKEDLKKLQAKFDGSRSELVKFLSELNERFRGRILDEIVNAYKAVKTLRKNNIPVPPEVKKLLPFAIHLAQFGHEKKFDYVIDIRKGDTVREMTNGEIEACHGDYHGTGFKNNAEVKRVKIISPGWKYEDKIISEPEFHECSDSED